MSKRRPPAAPPPPGPFHNPFGALRERLGGLPATPAEPREPAAPVAPEPGAPPGARGPAPRPAAAAPSRAVVRLERKGRGGKEATLVEKLGLPPAELERWLKELKRALGCGGAVEGDALVLQGDLRERLAPLLLARGVRKVVRG